MKNNYFLVSIAFISLFLLFQPLSSTIYSKVSGKVVDEETGIAVEGTIIRIYKKGITRLVETQSNKKGEFSISNITPGTYGIVYMPPKPYAWNRVLYYEMNPNFFFPKGMNLVTVQKGKNVYIVKKCKIGGVLDIQTFEKGTNIPVPDVSLYIRGVNLELLKNRKTDSQGKYHLSQLTDGKIHIYLNKDGIWEKEISDLEIQHSQTTRIDIPYDLNSLTKITGSVKCSQTGEPIKEIMIFIGSLDRDEGSRCRVDENGQFSMLDMKPGRYEIRIYGYNEINGEKERIKFAKVVFLTKNNPVNVNFVLDCSMQYRKEAY